MMLSSIKNRYVAFAISYNILLASNLLSLCAVVVVVFALMTSNRNTGLQHSSGIIIHWYVILSSKGDIGFDN